MGRYVDVWPYLMTTLAAAAKLALALPGVVEGSSRGSRSWQVAGKTFAWERPFSKADLRRFGDRPPPDGDILAVRVADLNEKDAALAEYPQCFFTIPHFDGHAAILIHLKKAPAKPVRQILREAWLVSAPADLRDTGGSA